MRMMSRQIEIINKHTELTKNNQKGIRKLKNIVTKTKNYLEALNKRSEWAEEGISEPEDRSWNLSEEKEKWMKKIEQASDICGTISIPKGEEGSKKNIWK